MQPRLAIVLSSAEHFGEAAGQIYGQLPEGIFVTCPNCGDRYRLHIPPFTYDPATRTIGPASIRLGACGFHGRVRNGIWELWAPGDTPCKKAANSEVLVGLS